MNTLARLRSGRLQGSTRLQLACGLTEFPREIFDLADSLEILDLSGNALRSLPSDLPRLRKLRVLFCSHNQFTELPGVLGQCQHLSMVGFKANQIRNVPGHALPRALRWLILTDNQVHTLPAEIGHCTQLQKLMLAGNQLQTLPPELAACTQLELLRIAANRLATFPTVLRGLPRLTWLAFAGNPFCAALEAATPAHAPAPIAWRQLRLGRLLGEGASGRIHQAELLGEQGTQAVAVKLFKGAVTSDGLPQCEMAACLRAGTHPHLIAVVGTVVDHPQGDKGLVMSLVDSQFDNLAGPPNLESCTRDIYAANASFDLPTVLRLAWSVTSAVRHLHAQGLMHGDIYAHNILYTAQGTADATHTTFLGDLGAASFVDPDDVPTAHALQRMEVRAIGYLLQELLARCPTLSDASALAPTLHALVERCCTDVPDTRPLLDEVERVVGWALEQSTRAA